MVVGDVHDAHRLPLACLSMCMVVSWDGVVTSNLMSMQSHHCAKRKQVLPSPAPSVHPIAPLIRRLTLNLPPPSLQSAPCTPFPPTLILPCFSPPPPQLPSGHLRQAALPWSPGGLPHHDNHDVKERIDQCHKRPAHWVSGCSWVVLL